MVMRVVTKVNMVITSTIITDMIITIMIMDMSSMKNGESMEDTRVSITDTMKVGIMESMNMDMIMGMSMVITTVVVGMEEAEGGTKIKCQKQKTPQNKTEKINQHRKRNGGWLETTGLVGDMIIGGHLIITMMVVVGNMDIMGYMVMEVGMVVIKVIYRIAASQQTQLLQKDVVVIYMLVIMVVITFMITVLVIMSMIITYKVHGHLVTTIGEMTGTIGITILITSNTYNTWNTKATKDTMVMEDVMVETAYLTEVDSRTPFTMEDTVGMVVMEDMVDMAVMAVMVVMVDMVVTEYKVVMEDTEDTADMVGMAFLMLLLTMWCIIEYVMTVIRYLMVVADACVKL